MVKDPALVEVKDKVYEELASIVGSRYVSTCPRQSKKYSRLCCLQIASMYQVNRRKN